MLPKKTLKLNTFYRLTLKIFIYFLLDRSRDFIFFVIKICLNSTSFHEMGGKIVHGKFGRGNLKLRFR